jgi:hypothetical protein
LAVLQGLLTRDPAGVTELAQHLGRPEADIEVVPSELVAEGLADVPPEELAEGDDIYVMTPGGLQALQNWALVDDPAGGKLWDEP